MLERSFRTEVGDVLGADFTLVDPSAHVDPGARLVPPVYVGPEAVVERGARAGSLAVLGGGARVGAGAVVESSVLGAGATVGPGSALIGSVVGDHASVGASCDVRNLAVVGPGAKLGRGNTVDHGLRIGADQTIPDEALRFS